MRRAILPLARVAMFVGILFALPNARLKAQFIDVCQTFTTQEYDQCPSCCTSSGDIPVLPFSTGAGTSALSPVNWSCGTARAGCGVDCSGTSYEQVADDAACCLTTGQACSTTAQCCGSPGDTCVNNVCTAPESGDGGSGNPDNCDPDADGDFDTHQCYYIIVHVNGMGVASTSAANAFLVLPAADGLVHGSMQLFDKLTPQPASATPSGLAALAIYDLPANGGNGDGIIDSRDAIYSHLRLWLDANHDGISQPEELHKLPSLGVASIRLNHR